MTTLRLLLFAVFGVATAPAQSAPVPPTLRVYLLACPSMLDCPASR